MLKTYATKLLFVSNTEVKLFVAAPRLHCTCETTSSFPCFHNAINYYVNTVTYNPCCFFNLLKQVSSCFVIKSFSVLVVKLFPHLRNLMISVQKPKFNCARVYAAHQSMITGKVILLYVRFQDKTNLMNVPVWIFSATSKYWFK